MRRKQPLVRGCRKKREPIVVRDLYSQRSRPIDSSRDTCVIFVKPDAPVYPRLGTGNSRRIIYDDRAQAPSP
jgi:hypothetical protein